jgi:DNA-binding beta-propeller fold protein YncE
LAVFSASTCPVALAACRTEDDLGHHVSGNLWAGSRHDPGRTRTRGVAATPDSKEVYIANALDNAVTVIGGAS